MRLTPSSNLSTVLGSFLYLSMQLNTQEAMQELNRPHPGSTLMSAGLAMIFMDRAPPSAIFVPSPSYKSIPANAHSGFNMRGGTIEKIMRGTVEPDVMRIAPRAVYVHAQVTEQKCYTICAREPQDIALKSFFGSRFQMQIKFPATIATHSPPTWQLRNDERGRHRGLSQELSSRTN